MTTDLKPNRAQLAAIEFPIDRPLKVLAGAGTGKTAVLTQRFIHIVEKHDIRPSRILALTFTKKAAAEMRRRIIGGLLERGLMGRSEAPLLLWIGNFHSICLRLLRQYSLLAGLDPTFETINETEQRLLLADVAMDFLNEKIACARGPEEFEALMVERVDDFVDNVARVVNRLGADFVGDAIPARRLRALLEDQYRIIEAKLAETIGNEELHRNTRKAAERRLERLTPSRAHEMLLLDAVHLVGGEYRERLEESETLDFNDLITRACRLARTESSVRERFDYILVDEFQDTDGAQYKLLEALSRDMKNVTVVCDKKQSIYEWREARVENVDDFPGETISLDENYRSVGEILDSANRFVAQTMPDEKPLAPAAERGRGRAGKPQVKLYRASDREEEADYVACEIARLAGSGEFSPGDVAVLMRSVRHSRPFEDAFRKYGVPHTTLGGRGFNDLSETKDVLALLRLIDDPFDDVSMARILKSPIVGLGDVTLLALRQPREGGVRSFYDALCDSEAVGGLEPDLRDRLSVLVEAIETLANAKWSLTIGETISEALNRTGYLKYLACEEGVRGARFSNVSRFYKMATSFEERNPGAGIEEFLSYVEIAMEGDAGSTVAETVADAVRIMTVHQAKGLEFPVVFVVNLRNGAFPLKHRAGGFGYDERFGVYGNRHPGGDDLLRYEGGYGVSIKKALGKRRLLEENRIMYVAMTRAEKLLYLTSPKADADVKNDFFSQLEESAAGAGADSMEIVGAYETSPSLTEVEGKADRIMSEREITEAASRAAERIGRTLPSETGAAKTAVKLSYSALALFRQCPMKYALRYVYRLPLAPHEESREEAHAHIDAFTLGNLLHATLMHFHRGQRLAGGADAFEILRRLSTSLPPAIHAAAKEMLGRYVGHPLASTPTLFEEKEFHWKISADALEIVLRGKVDRIHREGDSLKIVDYKTGEPHAEAHALQLGIYKMAVEAVLDEREIATSNFYLSTGREISFDYTPEDLRVIRDGIIRDANRIGQGSFEVSESEHPLRRCADCGYDAFCKYKVGR